MGTRRGLRSVSAAALLCLVLQLVAVRAPFAVAQVPSDKTVTAPPAADAGFASPLLGEPEFALTDGACATDEAALAQAADLRRSAGLGSDSLTVAASVTDPSYHCTQFGVFMTDNERALLASVFDAQGQLSSLIEVVSDAATFAGAYLEGPVLTILSTDGKLGASLQTTSGSVRLVTAEYTEADLNASAKEIAHGVANDGTFGTETIVTRVNVNPKTNRVDVGVSNDVEKVAAFFSNRYGTMVDVHLEPLGGYSLLCSVNDCGTKGGVAIDHFNPSVGCTSGFVLQAKKGDFGAWNHYMLTAGHCIAAAGGVGDSDKWQNGVGTLVWGTNKAQDYWQPECGFWTKCISNDLGLFGLGGAGSPYNRYVIGNADVPINQLTVYNNQLIGQVLNRHGRTSGLDAGSIAEKPEYYAYSCWPYTCKQYNLVKVNLASDHGDSGSGFYRLYSSGGVTYRSAYGALSGGPVAGASPTYYSAWSAELDAQSGEPFERWWPQLCVTSSCPLN